MSVAIFSLGMLAYGVTSGSIMDKNTKSTKKSIATTIAQDQIENIKIRAHSYLLVVPADTTEVATDVVDEEGEIGATGAKYTRSRGPVTLVHQETAEDRSTALKREHAIKKLALADKEALIRGSDV